MHILLYYMQMLWGLIMRWKIYVWWRETIIFGNMRFFNPTPQTLYDIPVAADDLVHQHTTRGPGDNFHSIYNTSHTFMWHMVYALLWFDVSQFYPYLSGLLHWCLGNHCLSTNEIALKNKGTKTKLGKPKPCAYFMAHTTPAGPFILDYWEEISQSQRLMHQQLSLASGRLIIHWCIMGDEV